MGDRIDLSSLLRRDAGKSCTCVYSGTFLVLDVSLSRSSGRLPQINAEIKIKLQARGGGHHLDLSSGLLNPDP